MDTMNDLLICAKAVGRTAPLITSPVTSDGEMRIPSYVLVVEKGRSVEYTPRTNDAQAMELLKWLVGTNPIHISTYADGPFRVDHFIVNKPIGKGQTLNEAIIKAVVAMEDTHE